MGKSRVRAMLSHLQISNFTLVKQLDIELKDGLTVLTGETGAGKSILLDALNLALGDRADADKVRHDAERADIQVTFQLDKLPQAQQWLCEHELGSEECLLRRVVTKEGRSRAYINGQNVTLQQLRTLGEMLVDIHGQHEHQSLLKTPTHQQLLDEFGQIRELSLSLKQHYTHWKKTREQLKTLRDQSNEMNARLQLLSYQVEELDQLNVQDNELQSLEDEQKHLSNHETMQQHCGHVLSICTDEQHGLNNHLCNAIKLLNELAPKPLGISNAQHLLEQALIHVQEAQSDLEHQQNMESPDPGRLAEIELRLSKIYDIARKHRVHAEELNTLHQQLSSELNGLKGSDEQIVQLEETLKTHERAYQDLAKQLTKKRQQAAKKLCKRINAQLKQLAMVHANFHVELTPHHNEPSPSGNEQVQFMISTVPGQPPKALAKIASGGELSRISLAIQVVTAQTSTIPTLIFDEVDVGIGGTTGDVVGQLLRELAQQGQVLCVTHLAQVASKSHHHLQVEKTIRGKTVNSSLKQLDDGARVLEIARMMGGVVDSKQSLAHARALLAETR